MTALIPVPLWRIVDQASGQQVGTWHKNQARAMRRACVLDQENGAHRFDVLRVYLPADQRAELRGRAVDVTV